MLAFSPMFQKQRKTRSLTMMVLRNMEKVAEGIWQATKSASNYKHKTNKQGHSKNYIQPNYLKHNVT